jgi:hypothetical protein
MNPPIEVYDNLLPWIEFDRAYADLSMGDWKYVNKTGDHYSTTPVKYLSMDLSENKFYTEKMLKIINERTGRNFIIHRIYANGQVHGQNGILHIDDTRDNAWTFLQYMNVEWYVTWGGHTVFYHEKQPSSYIPTPNSGVLFKANILHSGLEPTSACDTMRVVIAYKLLEV